MVENSVVENGPGSSLPAAETGPVLVVDDEEGIREIMSEILVENGLEVTTAACAEEALALCEKTAFDLIVTDLAMPGMNGFEAIQILKQQPETSDITMIACSALATRKYKDKASQVGCEGYITKPIEPNRLVEQVTRFMLASKIRNRLVQQETSDKG